ncbi:unnamed protein product, partial [Mesorhabditis belari]|uniref:Uncharacterized protein n=1 Tax=Mesorhabditis belari TaxID=2138241 RepID=A0AAF3FHF4_9BILA
MSAQFDELQMCRMLCANRLRRLERYKKAKSFCSLDEENAGENLLMSYQGRVPEFGLNSTSMTDLLSPASSNAVFEVLHEKMRSLLENDMSLMQQLVSLSDKVNELKVGMRRARSERKLSGGNSSEDEEEARPRSEEPRNGEGSAVTTLYVDNEAPQYFSRKNSVLRIPIPPRASNRFNRRPARRVPSDALRVQIQNGTTSLREDREEEEETIRSDRSDHPEDPLSSPALTYSHSSASSCASVSQKKTRSSHSSIDSALPPSPTVESD